MTDEPTPPPTPSLATPSLAPAALAPSSARAKEGGRAAGDDPAGIGLRHLRGVKSLVHDAVDGVVDLVRIGHRSTARLVIGALEVGGPLPPPMKQADALREALTEGILNSIQGVNRLVEGLSDAGLDALSPAAAGGPPTMEALVPLRSDAVGSAVWMADAAVGATNGVVGDQLRVSPHSLDLGLSLRSREAWIGTDGQGIPAGAGPRVVVLVHGLATTEWSWCMDAALHWGDPATNFGTLLEAELGYTPVYARYNTGRPIRESGRALALRLEALVQAWPEPVEDLVLIGHSMGGLVLRSALRHGQRSGHGWVRHVQRAVTLASPLRGAPLEQLGAFAGSFLSAIDLPGTLITGRILQGRSAGIRDLGEPHSAMGGPEAEADLPPDISWCFVTASLGPSPDHPLSRAFGDGLVHVESAAGPTEGGGQPEGPRARVHHVSGLHHAAIQVHPEVYALLRAFLSEGRAG